MILMMQERSSAESERCHQGTFHVLVDLQRDEFAINDLRLSGGRTRSGWGKWDTWMITGDSTAARSEFDRPATRILMGSLPEDA